MGFLKRLWTRLDDVVAGLEDHDALVEAALRELAGAETKARGELRRVRDDGGRLHRRLAQERANARGWRAAAARESNDTLALELLRHARRAARRGAELERRVGAHGAAEGRLEEHAAALHERIETLRREHHLMRTRRAQAEAMPIAAIDDAPIEELLSRWDMVLTRSEHVSDPWGELERDEEECALREELRAIRMKEVG